MRDTQVGGGYQRPIQKVRVRESGWTKKARKAFLDELATGCNVRMAAEAAGKSARRAYELRARDPVFAGLWKEALQIGYERLEAALLRYALEGVNAIEVGAEAPRTDPILAATGHLGEDVQEMQPVAERAAPRVEISIARAQLGLAILNRYRATVEGRKPVGRGPRRATAEETDTALRAKLATLARKVTVH